MRDQTLNAALIYFYQGGSSHPDKTHLKRLVYGKGNMITGYTVVAITQPKKTSDQSIVY